MTIIGYKGGGKGGGGSSSSSGGGTEQPDSLRSISYARIIDLVSEGEIEGLATGDLRSVYLDRTPVMNESGGYNFRDVRIATRNGTQAQTYIPGFPSVESENSVGVEFTYATPITRTISNTECTHVRVTIGTPAMSYTNTRTGDVTGTVFNYQIEIQPDGGAFTAVVTDGIRGKTTSRYQRSHLIKLPGTGPWNVRCVRITEDSDSAYLVNKSYWDSYTEIIDAKLSYPNSALVALVINSAQFTNIPVRGYDTKLLRTKIPSNATVNDDGSLSYSGTWDGTFQIAWHSNPAWCWYDMLITDRYGLGAFVDEDQVDKWTLYTIGQYCDEQVPDGFGGFEPRFSCNLYLQTQAEAFTVMRDMASIFRGMTYWASGLITPVQDSPSDPVALYSNSNVIGGVFTYSGTSARARHSVALVSWNDPEDFYTQKIEYVEDADAIARMGIVTTQVVATGCTSRGQAHRVGKWLLYSEFNETETVSFKAGLDSVMARPGQIISVQDYDRAGKRYSGRVASATTTSITIDAEFTVEVGATYTLNSILPDGTVGEAAVSSISGTTVNLSTALPAAPLPDAIWMLTSSNLYPQQFRVIGVTENGDGTFEIAGLEYNATKYDFVEEDIILTENPISLLTLPPDSPTNLTATESLYSTGTDVRVQLDFGWDAVERAVSYVVTYARDDTAPVIDNYVLGTLFEIRDAQPGYYIFTVSAVGANGKRSAPSTLSKLVFGRTLPPSDVADFSLQGVSDGVAHLTWTRATDLDVLIGGYVRIRYSPATTGALWADAVDIGAALPGTATNASVPHVNGTYLAKFVDSSGIPSVNAVEVSTTIASLLNRNIVDTITESPAFAGTKTYCMVSSLFGGLLITGDTLWDDLGEIDLLDDVDFGAGLAETAYYDFENTLDLGAVYTSLITASLAVQGIDVIDLIDSRGEVDSWTDIDGTDIDDVNAALYVRTTTDDPSSSPTWTDWRPFFIGQYVARAMQFQLRLTSNGETNNIVVTDLSVTVDMADRTEAASNITSGAAPYAVTFTNGFWQTPAIGITMQNAASGDYYTISSASATGFTVTFKNSGGTTISRVFDWMAKGQGYKH